MAENRVPTVRTTPTMDAFAEALLRAVPDASSKACGVLWAHFALETGRGHHCYGWNLGNVKWTPGAGDYQALRGVWEIDRATGQRYEIPPEKPGAWFRVWPSLDAGMRHFVESKRLGQWRSAWWFVLAGDTDGYALELNRLRYYTATPASYVAGLRPHFTEWCRSGAFERAKAKLDALRDADTKPDLPNPPSEPQPIVHPAVPLGRPALDGDDPDDAA